MHYEQNWYLYSPKFILFIRTVNLNMKTQEWIQSPLIALHATSNEHAHVYNVNDTSFKSLHNVTANVFVKGLTLCQWWQWLWRTDWFQTHFAH